jgi:hypothetical protein
MNQELAGTGSIQRLSLQANEGFDFYLPTYPAWSRGLEFLDISTQRSSFGLFASPNVQLMLQPHKNTLRQLCLGPHKYTAKAWRSPESSNNLLWIADFPLLAKLKLRNWFSDQTPSEACEAIFAAPLLKQFTFEILYVTVEIRKEKTREAQTWLAEVAQISSVRGYALERITIRGHKHTPQYQMSVQAGSRSVWTT